MLSLEVLLGRERLQVFCQEVNKDARFLWSPQSPDLCQLLLRARRAEAADVTASPAPVQLAPDDLQLCPAAQAQGAAQTRPSPRRLGSTDEPHVLHTKSLEISPDSDHLIPQAQPSREPWASSPLLPSGCPTGSGGSHGTLSCSLASEDWSLSLHGAGFTLALYSPILHFC